MEYGHKCEQTYAILLTNYPGYIGGFHNICQVKLISKNTFYLKTNKDIKKFFKPQLWILLICIPQKTPLDLSTGRPAQVGFLYSNNYMT